MSFGSMKILRGEMIEVTFVNRVNRDFLINTKMNEDLLNSRETKKRRKLFYTVSSKIIVLNIL